MDVAQRFIFWQVKSIQILYAGKADNLTKNAANK